MALFGLTAFLSLAIVVTLLILIEIYQRKKAAEYYEEELVGLQSKYPEIFNNATSLKFYTSGHPYVWVNSDFKEWLEGLKASCRGPKGVPIKARYSLRVDRVKEHVYFVPGIESFDFSSLMRYDEWLEDGKKYSQKIAEYKKSRNET
ncbi:hypothetical protein NBRC116493_17620 [Aurantivibrio infirmus]